MTAELSPKVFAILSGLIEERTGLSYGLRDQASFGQKVSERMREAGFDSALDYYYFLRYDAGAERELESLVAALVVTETYFYREAESLRTAVDEVVRPSVLAGNRPRIWSAACASGDEPLTIAMLLAEAGMLDRVEIVASDISLRALERARESGWTSRALRALPVGAEPRWIRREGDRIRVDRSLVDAIAWHRVNLLDDAAVRTLGMFDLIVCRNVLIYFSDATIRQVIERLSSMLRPDGRLLVGVSESLLRFGTNLNCEELHGCFFYRRAS